MTKLIAISGSLRRNSYNTAALKYAQQVLPEGVELEIIDIAPVPFYNEDVEKAQLPESVQKLAEKLAEADGLLIATPEYNGSIPGVLKNVLDWISRPGLNPAIRGKVAGIIGVAGSPSGGVRAYQHLATILGNMRMQPITEPAVLIGRAYEKFDSEGRLTDEVAREKIRDLVAQLTNQEVLVGSIAA